LFLMHLVAAAVAVDVATAGIAVDVTTIRG
jgi:hypothetical protein